MMFRRAARPGELTSKALAPTGNTDDRDSQSLSRAAPSSLRTRPVDACCTSLSRLSPSCVPCSSLPPFEPTPDRPRNRGGRAARAQNIVTRSCRCRCVRTPAHAATMPLRLESPRNGSSRTTAGRIRRIAGDRRARPMLGAAAGNAPPSAAVCVSSARGTRCHRDRWLRSEARARLRGAAFPPPP